MNDLDPKSVKQKRSSRTVSLSFCSSWHMEMNGMPDCRIQKADSYTGRYRDMYLFDNGTS